MECTNRYEGEMAGGKPMTPARRQEIASLLRVFYVKRHVETAVEADLRWRVELAARDQRWTDHEALSAQLETAVTENHPDQSPAWAWWRAAQVEHNITSDELKVYEDLRTWASEAAQLRQQG